MNLLPARPRRRRHPEGRSGAEEARSALPSAPGTGTIPPSRRMQENHPATAQRLPSTPQIASFQSQPSGSKLSLVPLSKNWGPPQTSLVVLNEWLRNPARTSRTATNPAAYLVVVQPMDDTRVGVEMVCDHFEKFAVLTFEMSPQGEGHKVSVLN